MNVGVEFEFTPLGICNYKHFFQRKSNLKTLVIPRTFTLGDTLIQYCVRYLPKLEKLHLGKLNNLIKFLPHLSNIKSLRTLVLEKISPELEYDIAKLHKLRPDISIEVLSESEADDEPQVQSSQDFVLNA